GGRSTGSALPNRSSAGCGGPADGGEDASVGAAGEARARVEVQDVPEVVEAVDRREADSRIRRPEQPSELGRRGAAEGERGAGDAPAALVPDARVVAAAPADAVDRIEVRADRRVDAVGARRPVARWVRRELDPRQIRLECGPVVVLQPAAVEEQRARELDRPRLLRGVAARPGPDALVRDPVEVVVRPETAAEVHVRERPGEEAVAVVA